MKQTWWAIGLSGALGVAGAAACSSTEEAVQVQVEWATTGVEAAGNVQRAQLVVTALELQRCSQPLVATARALPEAKALPAPQLAHHTLISSPTRLQATRIFDALAPAGDLDSMQPPAVGYCSVLLEIAPVDDSIDDVPTDSPLRGLSLRFAIPGVVVDTSQARSLTLPLAEPLQLSAASRRWRLRLAAAVDQWSSPQDAALTGDPATLTARIFDRAAQSLQASATATP